MNKALVIIFDGFGEGDPQDSGNAIEAADMKFYKNLKKNYPSTTLKATGEAVGLPDGFMGNSEVGHFTIGSGRIAYQSLEKINKSIREGDFFQKAALIKAAEIVKANQSKIHLVGMMSDEGVHAQLDHLFALLEFCKQQKLEKVYIHAITDGRDVEERSAREFIEKIINKTKELGLGKIATICGRYYSMDRDNNMDRTEKAFQLMTSGEGFEAIDPLKAIEEAYSRGDKTDYYIQPIILDKAGLIESQDAVIFFNFRTDRAKQLALSFTETTSPYLPPEQFVCFGPYSQICPVLYPAEVISSNLGEYLSKKGIKQLRAAETEKFAHVTFFFNSQIKEPYQGEDRLMVKSPKCASFAEKPEMSAIELTDKVINVLHSQKEYDFIAINYANGDLVGHSGNFDASVKACQVLDDCLSKLIPAAQAAGYQILFTADHGNIEEMKYPNGDPKPAHSMNEVPCILISEQYKNAKLQDGRGLQDIAPTILDLMGLDKPSEMSGESLIAR